MLYGRRERYYGQHIDHKGSDAKYFHESTDSDGAVMDCVVEDRRGSLKKQHNVDDNYSYMSEDEMVTHIPTYRYHRHGQPIEHNGNNAKCFHESMDSDGAVMDCVVEDRRGSLKIHHNVDDNVAYMSDKQMVTHIPTYRYHRHGQPIEYKGSAVMYSYDTMDSDEAVMGSVVEDRRGSSKRQHNVNDNFAYTSDKQMVTHISTGQRIEHKGSDAKYSYDTMDSEGAVMGVLVEDRRGSSKRQVQFTLFGALAETLSMPSNQYTGGSQNLDGSSGTSPEGYPFITQTEEPEERDGKLNIDIKSCRAAILGVTGAMMLSCLDSCDHYIFYPITCN